MLFIYLLTWLGASNLAFAILNHRSPGARPRVTKHGMFPASLKKNSNGIWGRAPRERRQAADPTNCGSGTEINTKAPKKNIFAGLTNEEAAAVTSFLHDQKSLNLTATANATRSESLLYCLPKRDSDIAIHIVGITKFYPLNSFNRTSQTHSPI